MKHDQDFQRIRELLPNLHTHIQKRVPTKYLAVAGPDLGLYRNKTFVFVSEIDIVIFADYLLYSYQPHGISMVRRHPNLNRTRLDPLPWPCLRPWSRRDIRCI